MSKKIAAILAFVLAIQWLGLLPLNVEATTIANKIDKELQTIMETISEDEAIPVAVRVEGIEHDGSYWTSYDTTGNVQLLAFDPRVMGGVGTYTIQVTRLTDYDTKIYFGLSWY